MFLQSVSGSIWCLFFVIFFCIYSTFLFIQETVGNIVEDRHESDVLNKEFMVVMILQPLSLAGLSRASLFRTSSNF